MIYALIRPTERSDEGGSALIVARERLDSLSKFLGKPEVVAEIQGCRISNRLADFMLTLACRIWACWCSLSSPLYNSCATQCF